MTPAGEQRVIALLERLVAATERASAPRAEWLAPKDVAALLGVDVRTLRRMRHEGGLPKPVQTGRLLRWKRADVERFLQGRAT